MLRGLGGGTRAYYFRGAGEKTAYSLKSDKFISVVYLVKMISKMRAV
jgi:hypothetical protein